MILFIIGATKTGKSSLSRLLQSLIPTTPHHYEAGSWARIAFDSAHPGPHDEHDPLFKDRLTAFALDELRANPLRSVEHYRTWRQSHPGSLIISGVRNPEDFVHFTALEQTSPIRILFLTSQTFSCGPTLSLFEQGIPIIRSYVHWKNSIAPFFLTLDLDPHELDVALHTPDSPSFAPLISHLQSFLFNSPSPTSTSTPL